MNKCGVSNEVEKYCQRALPTPNKWILKYYMIWKRGEKEVLK